MTLAEKKRLFNSTLFAWQKKNYRVMPWRDTHDAYRILVSEVMLQQTQVLRVMTKYAEFLKKFPTVRILAESNLGDVLRIWSGLGYNRRAKYLHECAKKVVAEHGGKFPDDFEELMKLPGIGISTAGALLAFAFVRDEPMIDTNIRRILVRVFFQKKIPGDKELFEFAKTLIPKGKGRMWNYAMLDLGATLCTARNHSVTCPIQKLHGPVEDFVYKKPQKKFAHSDRFYRGRIIARLIVGATTKAKLQKELELVAARLNILIEKLLREKLIIVRRQTLRIP